MPGGQRPYGLGLAEEHRSSGILADSGPIERGPQHYLPKYKPLPGERGYLITGTNPREVNAPGRAPPPPDYSQWLSDAANDPRARRRDGGGIIGAVARALGGYAQPEAVATGIDEPRRPGVGGVARRPFEDGGIISGWVDGVADQDEPGQAQAARETAARGVARGAQHHVPPGLLPPEGSEPAPPEAFPQRTWMFQPGLQESQTGDYELPHGAQLDEMNRPYYPDTGRRIQVLRRPGILPVAPTPDGPQFVMPKLLDLASNVMSPLLAGRVPVKAGEMVLGSGAIRTAAEAAPAAEKAAEPFYSTLERAVEGAKLQKGSPEQWMGYLRNQPGVKPDELDMALGDWLKQQSGPVTKQQIADFVRDNKVEVKEVAKGGRSFSYDEVAKLANENPNELLKEMVGAGIPEHDALRRLNDIRRGDHYETQRAGTYLRENGDKSQTKYGTHVLPGGENYREKLLTLPEKPSAFDPSQVEIKRHMKSLTQGETSIWYGGKKVMQYGDDPVLQPGGGYDQKPKAYWMDVAKQLYDKGDRINKVPSRSENFTSGHWDEPNVLAHVRMNDRMVEAPGDNAPRKSLHLEEIQSDWHQKGRAHGYQGNDIAPEQRSALEAEKGKLAGEVADIEEAVRKEAEQRGLKHSAWMEHQDEHLYKNPEYRSRMDRITAINYELHPRAGAVPDAPFKKTWHELALKSALRDAVQGGYDRLSWTPGEAQAARYDLSKHLSEVHYSGSNLTAYDHAGKAVIQQTGVKAADLPGLIGKEAADRLLAQPQKGTLRSLSGLDLIVGGEGMKGFYDQIVPKALEKLTKKYGVKVKSAELPSQAKVMRAGPEDWRVVGDDNKGLLNPSGEPLSFKNEAAANAHLPKVKRQPVHYIDIPQALKDDILKNGQPLFARGGAVKKAKAAVIETAQQLAAKSAIRRAMHG